MAENGSLSASENGRHPPPFAGEVAMAHRVDPAMQQMKTTGIDKPRDE
jgi:hypothetical protein